MKFEAVGIKGDADGDEKLSSLLILTIIAPAAIASHAFVRNANDLFESLSSKAIFPVFTS